MPIPSSNNVFRKPYFGPEELPNKERELLWDWQSACAGSFAAGLQMKQEAYLTRHPEVKALLQIFLCKIAKARPQRGILEMAKNHFTRPVEELDKEIRDYMKLPSTGPYFTGKVYSYTDQQLHEYLLRTKEQTMMPPEPPVEPSLTHVTSSDSSAFSTYVTSDTTQPTPEPIATPPPTLSEHMFSVVSGAVDKAIFLKVNDEVLLYDTAWVELSKITEEAMEVPVVEVKDDIVDLLHGAYKSFELHILEKERIAFEEYLANRMKRTTKKTLRKIANFKGYKPPSPILSSTEAATNAEYYTEVTRTEPRVAATYNRYSKDRFGVYRAIGDELNIKNATVTPPLSTQSSELMLADEEADTGK